MPTVKIVADSSCDLLTLSEVPFTCVPLKVITAEREYLDNIDLDVAQMVQDLQHYKGRSSSSCPNMSEWLAAFGDADEVYCVPITATLSGSYNAACLAKETYEEAHPDRRVYVLNTLSAGAELELLAEKLQELIAKGTAFDDVCKQIEEYSEHTGLLFSLESMKNFANNGRVSPLAAKAAGLLGIRVVGKASEQGDLQPLDKCRGIERAVQTVAERMTAFGYGGGRVCIHHCDNEFAARLLCERLWATYSDAPITVRSTRGLCSFYAEQGGLLVGYEKK